MNKSPQPFLLNKANRLDSHGPRLIVFFEKRPLTDCDLQGYDFYDVSFDAASDSDIRYYFVRRGQ